MSDDKTQDANTEMRSGLRLERSEQLVKYTVDVQPSESYTYTNVSAVSISPFDIRINFADATPYGTESKTTTVIGLVIPPEHAAGLAILLCAQALNFEEQFGPIRHKQWKEFRQVLAAARMLTEMRKNVEQPESSESAPTKE